MPTKAENLVLLKNYQKKINIKIPKILYFTKKDFLKNKKHILEKINKNFSGKKIILRSSSMEEDKDNISNSGKFKSYPNLIPEIKSVEEKIDDQKATPTSPEPCYPTRQPCGPVRSKVGSAGKDRSRNDYRNSRSRTRRR